MSDPTQVEGVMTIRGIIGLVAFGVLASSIWIAIDAIYPLDLRPNAAYWEGPCPPSEPTHELICGKGGSAVVYRVYKDEGYVCSEHGGWFAELEGNCYLAPLDSTEAP